MNRAAWERAERTAWTTGIRPKEHQAMKQELIARRYQLAVLLCVGALLGAILLVWSQSQVRQLPVPLTIEPVISPTPEPPTPEPTSTAIPPIAVYVTGAVANPGVVWLPADSRIDTAIKMAGGATKDADLEAINLAARLQDGQQIYVPRHGEQVTPLPAPTSSTSAPSSTSSPAAGPVNINTATAAQLDSLPHIGPALAARIVAYRTTHGPFKTTSDIQAVPGIGASIYSAIQDLITAK